MELVIISGASRGIGAAIARVASDRSDTTVATLSRGDTGFEHHLGVDLATIDGWTRAADWIDETISVIAPHRVVLFHCAATIVPIGFAGEVEAKSYASAVMLNSGSPQVLGASFVGALQRHGIPGLLVQISSGAATTPYPGWSGYCAAKAAVEHWTRTVGEELEHRGDPIRVIAVAPGVVDTDMQAEIRKRDVDEFPNVGRFESLKEDGRLRDADEVGSEMMALAERSDIANGAILDLRSTSQDSG